MNLLKVAEVYSILPKGKNEFKERQYNYCNGRFIAVKGVFKFIYVW